MNTRYCFFAGLALVFVLAVPGFSAAQHGRSVPGFPHGSMTVAQAQDCCGPVLWAQHGHGGHVAPGMMPLYTTTGVIEVVDQATGKLTISHKAIPALNWPEMSMRFLVENPSFLLEFKAGDKVSFDFYGRDNDYVIRDMDRMD